MNEKTASNFINSLVKNLQVLCHSNVDFSDNVEVIGHIYLSVDKSTKFNYIVNEKVCKSDEASTMFVSNSFHAEDSKRKEAAKINSKQPTENSRPVPAHSNNPFIDHRARQSNDYTGLKQLHNRHKRSFSMDGGNNGQSLSVNKFPRNETSNERSTGHNVSPHYGGRRDSVHEKSYNKSPSAALSHAVDLNRVKQEPASSVESSSSSQCLFGSDNTETVTYPGSRLSAAGFPGLVHSPHLGGTGTNLDTGQFMKTEFNRILDNTTEIVPVGMLHSSESSHVKNVLPSISTLTSPGYGLPSPAASTIASLIPISTRLTLEDKIEIIKAAESSDKPCQSLLASKYGVSQPAISNILKRKDIYLAADLERTHSFPESQLRHTLSLKDKIEIIRDAESSGKPSQTYLAAKFGVSQPAINRILKKRDIYLSKYLHQHTIQGQVELNAAKWLTKEPQEEQ